LLFLPSGCPPFVSFSQLLAGRSLSTPLPVPLCSAFVCPLNGTPPAPPPKVALISCPPLPTPLRPPVQTFFTLAMVPSQGAKFLFSTDFRAQSISVDLPRVTFLPRSPPTGQIHFFFLVSFHSPALLPPDFFVADDP